MLKVLGRTMRLRGWWSGRCAHTGAIQTAHLMPSARSRMLLQPTQQETAALPDRKRRNSSPRRVMTFDPTGEEEVRVSDICGFLACARLAVEGRGEKTLTQQTVSGPRERLIEALKLLMETPRAKERMKTIDSTHGGIADVETEPPETTTSPLASRSRRRRSLRSSASSSSPSTIALTSSTMPGAGDSSPTKRFTSPTRRKAGNRRRRVSSFRSKGDTGYDSSSSSTGGMQYEKLEEEDGLLDGGNDGVLLQPPAAPPFDQRAPRRFVSNGPSAAGAGRAVSASPRMNWKSTPRKSGVSRGGDEPNRNSVAEEISPVSFGGSERMDYFTKPGQRISRPSRHLMLYQRGMQSKEDRLRRLERVKEAKEMEELASCTFKPQTRGSSISAAPASTQKSAETPNTDSKSVNPRGYTEAVSRLQRGYRERQLMREVVENRDPDGAAMQQLIRNQKACDTSNIDVTPGSRSSAFRLPRGGTQIGRRTGGRGVRRAPPDGDAPATSISPPTTERNKRNSRTSEAKLRPSSSRTPNNGRLSVKRESPYARLPSISKRNSHPRGRGRAGRADGEWIEVEVTRNSETGSDRRYVVGKLLIQEGQLPRAIHEAVIAFSQKHRLKTSETIELHKVLKHKLDTKDYDDIPSQRGTTPETPTATPYADSPTPPPVNTSVNSRSKPPSSSPRPSRAHSPLAPAEQPSKDDAAQENAAPASNDCELSFGSGSSLEGHLQRLDELGLEEPLNSRQATRL
ncbi:hypothetical protein FOZ61_001275 [Perkinsus olseni]|uniref:Uncharacterized protein n=1 Tax=Perkinsus olseni TaxID=32597 RepID=A0A7J6LXQ6_PEROL|nr:hypothetical protein FOZ61_001275 [Perkinsus olseni]KAF4669384.1 hypothetical protein FOL46_001475 [Perkinsus olseni]